MHKDRDDESREGRRRKEEFQEGEIRENERFVPVSVRDEGFPPAALPNWPGPELAMAQIHDDFERIRHALQPVRPDIIERSVFHGLHVLHMLQEFWEGQPPGAFRRTYNPHPPFGGVRNTGETR